MGKNAKVDVSVIITVYNHEKYIAKALESVLNQETSYTYEILVGEDCSPDRSRDVIRKYEINNPEKIHAFYREKNMGGKNGYALWMAACGRYIMAFDGDDFWTDNKKMQKQVSFLDAHPEYIGVASNFSIIDENGNILKEKQIPDLRLNRKFTFQDFLERGYEFQSGTLVCRNFLLDGKDYSIFYKAHDLRGDLTVLTILLNRGDIYVMGDVMSVYRKVYSKTATNACSIMWRNEAEERLKLVRQYILLRPYLKNRRDFDYHIAKEKGAFLIGMIKHEEGYEWKRWARLQHIGGFHTNLLAIICFLKMCWHKLVLTVKK